MTPQMMDMVHDVPEAGVMNIGELNGSPQHQNFEDNRVQGMGELRAILEAVLFVSSEPLSLARLVTVMENVPKVEVEEALRNLGQALEQEGRGVRLIVVAGGYRLVTKQDYAPWIKRLDKAKTAAKLSRSALESLAIIAYKQPLVRSEIEEIRGVETSGVLRTLLERKLVRIVGRKEVPGRPIMYGTTKFFLEHFGLSDLSQLPPLREFKELGEAEQSLLPMDGGDVSSGEVSVEPLEAGVEPSAPLDEVLDPLPTAQ
ncbi:MAG TPA: SMC-Scp complex subunit ScpB [Nitrospira sp.]|nr:SMC-Scp complex subunit ScpB [Nitrospira sp.]